MTSQQRLLLMMQSEDFMWIVLCLLQEITNESDAEEEKTPFCHLLSSYGQRMRSGHIRQCALLPLSSAAFTRLFNSGKDGSLITLCGFCHSSFRALLQEFIPFFDKYTPFPEDGCVIHRRKRRRRKASIPGNEMSPVVYLALVLAWYRTRGSCMILSIVFGATHNSLSLWLCFGRRILTRALLKSKAAKVCRPSRADIDNYKAAIKAKYPALDGVWGAMDGLKLYFEQSGDLNEQSIFYNGWKSDHYINSLFIFSPDGLIRHCYFNAPGSLHDSTMAEWGKAYEFIESIFDETGGRIVVDSAFAAREHPSMLKSVRVPIYTSEVFRSATSDRQLSEWGMRGLQGSFPRLKDWLKFERRGERQIILQLVILLYNFRASTVGINQIQSSFMSHLERSANTFIKST